MTWKVTLILFLENIEMPLLMIVMEVEEKENEITQRMALKDTEIKKEKKSSFFFNTDYYYT